ncbi:TetR/AcrR family transcriptional regulator [Micromonospora sp. NPDC003197]
MITTSPGPDRLRRWRRLREAALVLFEEHGFAAVSVDEIAATAGVSRRTFFNHFDSKLGVLFDPDPDEAARVSELLAFEGDAQPWPALTRTLKAYLAAESRVVASRRRIIERQPELSHHHVVADAHLEKTILYWLAERGVGELPGRVLTGLALTCVRESLTVWHAEEGLSALFEIIDRMFALTAGGTAAIVGPVAEPVIPKAGPTRERILTTAEQLFAGHGVYSVSNRQISEAAGQGNNTAVGYHFGTKADLVRAIVARHATSMEQIRAGLLAQHGGSTRLRDWVSCVVLPFTEHLRSLDAPTWYARFAAQLLTEPKLRELAAAELHEAPMRHAVTEGLHRCLPALSLRVLRERDEMARTLIVHMCAQRERTLPAESEAAAAAWSVTAASLVDAIEGLYRAPADARP